MMMMMMSGGEEERKEEGEEKEKEENGDDDNYSDYLTNDGKDGVVIKAQWSLIYGLASSTFLINN